jgi:quinol monooxygenase YgiN
MPTEPAAPPTEPAVIELRQYTLHSGRRDELIELFDREFVETQEEAGMVVFGQFRDLEDPDRFVWLRGFTDMTTRQRALTAFYDGPVWAAHRDQANATMINSDDVLLLRPIRPGDGLLVSPRERQPVGTPSPGRLVVATLWSFPLCESTGIDLIRRRLLPLLRQAPPAPLAALVTEPAENTFPRLPVRTGENIVAVLHSYPDEAAYRRHLAEVQSHPAARDDILPAIAQARTAAEQIRRLAPTGRSLIR